jgi:KDO2-lipid IV(A) lauroyltransferase
MRKTSSQAASYTVYLVARIIICVIQAVSNSTARAGATALAWLFFILDKRHRLVAVDNLRKSFPGRYSETQLNNLVRANYRHLFTLVIEMCCLRRKIRAHNVSTYFDMGPKEETIRELLRGPRPLLIVTGHFGNWELAGYGLGVLGFKTHAVARPLDNPFLDRILNSVRQSSGQTILPKKDLPGIQRALAGGGKIAVLADQSAGPRGLAVDFFGRGASTSKGVAILALQHQAPMLVVGVRKYSEPMRYEVVVEDIIYPEEYNGYRADAVRRITQRYTSALERVIRTAPEQYFWLHNRWKGNPQVAKSLALAA